MISETDSIQSSKNLVGDSIWNHHPDLPIETSALFNWPPNFTKGLTSIAKSWFGLYTRGIALLIILCLWLTVHPSMNAIAMGGYLWILQIYGINILLITTVAGGLHLYFYGFSAQGTELAFDKPPTIRHIRFTFKSQVLDNVFWTLCSGVIIWTAYQSGLLWGLANSYLPAYAWQDGPVWFILFFVLIPFIDGSHFYVTNRMLHWKPLYKSVHSLHHRNVSVGPWSGLSMHPVEHIIFFSPVLVHLFLPSHPFHIVFHVSWLALGPVGTHTGVEALLVRGKKLVALGMFHHQLHHRYYDCNYGNPDIPLDNLAGSFHDGTKNATQNVKARQRQKVRSR